MHPRFPSLRRLLSLLTVVSAISAVALESAAQAPPLRFDKYEQTGESGLILTSLGFADLLETRGREVISSGLGEGDIRTLRVTPLSAEGMMQEFGVPFAADELLAANVAGDAREDVVGISAESPDAWILVSAGGTTLLPARIIPLGGPAAAMCAAEANGDRRADLAFALLDRAVARLVMSESFDATPRYRDVPLPYPADDLLWIDIEADGQLELVTASAVAGRVDVVTVNRAASTTPRIRTAFTLPGVSSVVALDANGDGAIDLVARSAKATVIAHGDGNGGFAAPVDLETACDTIHVFDADGDGPDDLALVSLTDQTIVKMRGTPSGFDPLGAESIETESATHRTEFVAFGDHDGDGISDLASSEFGSETTLVALGMGDGLFGRPQSFSDFNNDPEGIEAGDVNGDGTLDIVFIDGFHRVRVALGHGDGTFTNALLIIGSFNRDDLTLIDFDDDGDLDIASCGSVDAKFYANDGAGGFSLASSILITGTGIVGGSFDDRFDDHVDFAIANPDETGVSLLFGNGDGTFRRGENFGPIDHPRSLDTTDIDQDGHLDLMIAEIGRGRDLRIRFGTGFGTFDDEQAYSASMLRLGSQFTDLDGDATEELLFADESRVVYRMHDGQRSMVEHVIAEDRSVSVLTSGDFDGDGRQDVATADESGNAAFFLNRLPDAWIESTPVALPGDLMFGELHSVDFDSDSFSGLATWDEGILYLLRNRSKGLFCREGRVNRGVSDQSAVVLTVNGEIGEGPFRTVHATPSSPLAIAMDAPPSAPGGSAPFALYASPVVPAEVHATIAPQRLGVACLATPLEGAQPSDFVAIWNNTGKAALGTATEPSTPAPWQGTLDFPQGTPAVFLQGILFDADAPNGIAALTNGILVRPRE